MRYLLILFLIFSIKAEATLNQFAVYLNNDSLLTLPKNTEVKITYTTESWSDPVTSLYKMILKIQFTSDTGKVTSEFPLTIPTNMETTKTYTLLYKIPDYFVNNPTFGSDWAPNKTLGISVEKYVKNSYGVEAYQILKREYVVCGATSFIGARDHNNHSKVSLYYPMDSLSNPVDISILKTNTEISLKYLTPYDSTVNLVTLTMYHLSRDFKDTFNISTPVILRNPENTLTNSTYSTSFKVPSDLHPDTAGFYRLMVKEVRKDGELAHLPYYQNFYAPITSVGIHPIIRTSNNKPAKYPLTDILGRASISVPNFQVVW